VTQLHGLGEPRSKIGQVLASAEIAPTTICDKVAEWADGDWTPTLTSAQVYAQAAAAVEVVRVSVEAFFDFVTRVWISTAAQEAHNKFSWTLVYLDELVDWLTTCSANEKATADLLATIDSETAGLPGEIASAFRAFLDVDADQGGIQSAPGIGWIVSAGEAGVLTERLLAYNDLYLQLCACFETRLADLIALRQQFAAEARGRGVCLAATGSLPQPVPRF